MLIATPPPPVAFTVLPNVIVPPELVRLIPDVPVVAAVLLNKILPVAFSEIEEALTAADAVTSTAEEIVKLLIG